MNMLGITVNWCLIKYMKKGKNITMLNDDEIKKAGDRFIGRIEEGFFKKSILPNTSKTFDNEAFKKSFEHLASDDEFEKSISIRGD